MRTSTAMDAARSRSRDASSRGLELEPATVRPAPLIGGPPPDASIVPEKRLLLAVLEEAVVTFQRYVTDSGRRGRRLFREAEEWVGSDEGDWPCSFHNICDSLGLDPAYLRQGLRRWRDDQRAHPGLRHPHRHPFRRLSGSRTRPPRAPSGLRPPARRARRLPPGA